LRIEAFVRANARILDSFRMGPHLVHGDFDASNMIMRLDSGGWQVAAVIDWEHAFTGPALFDIAHILRPPCGNSPAFEAGLVSFFEAHAGPLPAHWKRIARFIDLLAWFDFLSRDNAPSWVVQTACNRIVQTMDEWEDA
jgi:Ser/Thr protein kinase RdoA (MazF antagonist)